MATADPSSSPPPPGRAAHPALIGLSVITLGCVAYGLYSSQRRHDQLEDRLAEVRAAVEKQAAGLQLLRFESRSKKGLGMEALCDQLAFWGEQYDHASTPQVERPAIQERLDGVLEAMEFIGGERAVAELERRFVALDAEREAAVREWVLRALAHLNTERSREVLATVARGLEFRTTPAIRLFAAKELLRLAPDRGAEVVRDILRLESAHGLDIQRVPVDQRPLYERHIDNFPANRAFYNYVDLFASSGSDDRESELLMLLGRYREHDLLTTQQAVKSLAALGSRQASDTIKQLFERPPDSFNPLFRNHCLDALAAILADDAHPYFREALAKERNELVRAKLNDLLGSG